MELPQSLDSVSARSIDEIRSTARATQANVVTLRVFVERRDPDQQLTDIRTPSPGPIRRHRDVLLDTSTLKSYSSGELIVRLRQVWGEFCALCWLFPHCDPLSPINFDPLPAGQDLRCINDARAKLAQVQTDLWRLIHEQRLRHDPDSRNDPAFHRDAEVAVTHRLRIYGVHVSRATDEQVFHAACEYAGMLAAFRWALDDRWGWEAPGIMNLPNSAPPTSR